jgi:predicted RNA binding protein with dsRBD fold (UPF0201 family)
MATVSELSRSAVPLRRVLEAVSNVVSEIQTARSTVEQSRPDVRPFLIRSTRNVIDHYRRVLANHEISEAERKAIRARLTDQERLLRDLVREKEKQTMPRRGCLEEAA